MVQSRMKVKYSVFLGFRTELVDNNIFLSHESRCIENALQASYSFRIFGPSLYESRYIKCHFAIHVTLPGLCIRVRGHKYSFRSPPQNYNRVLFSRLYSREWTAEKKICGRKPTRRVSAYQSSLIRC